MIEVMTLGALALVVLAVVGVACAWGLSRAMDAANSRAFYRNNRSARWAKVLERIESETLSCAIYYGARWVGICLLIGWLFSRAV